MKKSLLTCLAILLLFSFTACTAQTRETAETAKVIEQEAPESTEQPTPEPTIAPTEEPTTESTPQPTSIQATSRQDLLDYGFSKKNTNENGVECYSITSRITDSKYEIFYSEEPNKGWGGLNLDPIPRIENLNDKIMFYHSELYDSWVVQYYPDIDSEISAAVYKDLEGHKWYRGISEGFLYVINLDKNEIDAYSFGATPAYINEYVEKYVNLDEVYQEALEKHNEFNEYLQKEFGLPAEEMLALD